MPLSNVNFPLIRLKNFNPTTTHHSHHRNLVLLNEITFPPHPAPLVRDGMVRLPTEFAIRICNQTYTETIEAIRPWNNTLIKIILSLTLLISVTSSIHLSIKKTPTLQHSCYFLSRAIILSLLSFNHSDRLSSISNFSDATFPFDLSSNPCNFSWPSCMCHNIYTKNYHIYKIIFYVL